MCIGYLPVAVIWNLLGHENRKKPEGAGKDEARARVSTDEAITPEDSQPLERAVYTFRQRNRDERKLLSRTVFLVTRPPVRFAAACALRKSSCDGARQAMANGGD